MSQTKAVCSSQSCYSSYKQRYDTPDSSRMSSSQITKRLPEPDLQRRSAPFRENEGELRSPVKTFRDARSLTPAEIQVQNIDTFVLNAYSNSTLNTIASILGSFVNRKESRSPGSLLLPPTRFAKLRPPD